MSAPVKLTKSQLRALRGQVYWYDAHSRTAAFHWTAIVFARRAGLLAGGMRLTEAGCAALEGKE